MSDIQSVKRAFDILKAVSSNNRGVSLTEIAAHAQLPKSTASRMLSTLTGIGMVERVNEREGFRIGNELIAMAAHVSYPRSLIAIAHPFLQDLAQATGETLTLCVPDGDQVHYIDQINSLHTVQMRNWVGYHFPMYASCDGKLFLAERDDVGLERYLQQRLQRFTATTITSPLALRKELKVVRKRGYAWTNGEYDAELVGVSAPIRDVDQQVVATLCLFGPAFRWPTESAAGQLIEQTCKTAARISARLQAQGCPTSNIDQTDRTDRTDRTQAQPMSANL